MSPSTSSVQISPVWALALLAFAGGALLLLLFPDLRGSHPRFGWGPAWCLGMPLSSLLGLALTRVRAAPTTLTALVPRRRTRRPLRRRRAQRLSRRRGLLAAMIAPLP